MRRARARAFTCALHMGNHRKTLANRLIASARSGVYPAPTSKWHIKNVIGFYSRCKFHPDTADTVTGARISSSEDQYSFIACRQRRYFSKHSRSFRIFRFISLLNENITKIPIKKKNKKSARTEYKSRSGSRNLFPFIYIALLLFFGLLHWRHSKEGIP